MGTMEKANRLVVANSLGGKEREKPTDGAGAFQVVKAFCLTP